VKIVICGLSITSSWGNGHATTYRALTRALRARGHKIVFFERDLEWYASNRDMPEPLFCQVHLYEQWQDVVGLLRRELAEADVAMIGSFFPDGVNAIDEACDSAAGVKVFYDIEILSICVETRFRVSMFTSASPAVQCYASCRPDSAQDARCRSTAPLIQIATIGESPTTATSATSATWALTHLIVRRNWKNCFVSRQASWQKSNSYLRDRNIRQLSLGQRTYGVSFISSLSFTRISIPLRCSLLI